MSLTAYLLNNGKVQSLNISQYDLVNYTFTMQITTLMVSFVAMLLIFFVDKENFRTFFRRGSYWEYGLIVAVGFTAGTTMMMTFSATSQHGTINQTFWGLMPLVLLFAATNAWSEEIFTRFVVVVGLYGKLKPITICWIAAGVFGIPHFFGTPSGIFGVFMSGFLGFVLARSVLETKGMGWAWFIHFLQDVAIFGAGAAIIAGQP